MKLPLVVALVISAFLPRAESRAAMSEADYLSALSVAQGKVERTRSTARTASAVSSTIVRNLLGRYYEVGDSWDVAAWNFSETQMRKTQDPEQLRRHANAFGRFHYTVRSVKSGPNPEVVIDVTQLEAADPAVERLTLTMNDRLVQSAKEYRMRDGRVAPANAHGIHSSATILELLPLDVPDVDTAERRDATALPELPEEARAVAARAGYSPELSRSVWFEQDDFFGRAVDVLWQKGDPWPSYIKTPGGIAILLGRSGS
jgi:hypothetical protein